LEKLPPGPFRLTPRPPQRRGEKDVAGLALVGSDFTAALQKTGENGVRLHDGRIELRGWRHALIDGDRTGDRKGFSKTKPRHSGRVAAEQAAVALPGAPSRNMDRAAPSSPATGGFSVWIFLDFTDQERKVLSGRRVEMFHLDEIPGTCPSPTQPAFRKYLLENFICKTGITQYHFARRTEGDPPRSYFSNREKGLKFSADRYRLCGHRRENGHLAF